LTFPLEDCSEFGNFVITLIYTAHYNIGGQEIPDPPRYEDDCVLPSIQNGAMGFVLVRIGGLVRKPEFLSCFDKYHKSQVKTMYEILVFGLTHVDLRALCELVTYHCTRIVHLVVCFKLNLNLKLNNSRRQNYFLSKFN
jgi:hypothetical protein